MGGSHHGVDLTPIPPANKQPKKLTHKKIRTNTCHTYTKCYCYCIIIAKYAIILYIILMLYINIHHLIQSIYHITQPSKQDGIYTSTSSHLPRLSSDMICELRSFLCLPLTWLVKGAVTDPKEILVGIEIRITIVGFRPMYTTFLELHKNS